MKECEVCRGDGFIEEICVECGGWGDTECPDCEGEGILHDDAVCERCGGTGEIECPECFGMGDTSYTCFECEGEGFICDDDLEFEYDED